MVQLGSLYFIKQSFFDLVQDNTLPFNKPDDENGEHGRPAFCAIKIDQGNYLLGDTIFSSSGKVSENI